jgi:uncharacterized protein (DUF433 family)
MAQRKREPVTEIVGGEPYEYYPLGEYVVCAPGVCGGRPTFKYHPIHVRRAIGVLSGVRSIERVAGEYQVPVAAVQEALELAMEALNTQCARRGLEK